MKRKNIFWDYIFPAVPHYQVCTDSLALCTCFRKVLRFFCCLKKWPRFLVQMKFYVIQYYRKRKLPSKLISHNTLCSINNKPRCQPASHLLQFNYVYLYVVLGNYNKKMNKTLFDLCYQSLRKQKKQKRDTKYYGCSVSS